MGMTTNKSMGLLKWCLSLEPKDMKAFLSDDERWEALVRRDPQAGGDFVYGVLTTGVYCGLCGRIAHKYGSRGPISFGGLDTCLS